MFRFNASRPLRFAALIAAFCALASGQSTLGRITGTITDSTGLAVPGAAISVRETRTGQAYFATTNETGVYAVTLLPLGDYVLDARKDGFKTVNRSGLVIDVNTALTVDVVLEPGSISEKITVESSAAVIQTESAAIGNSRYEVQLKNLPVIVREI